jgi:HAD domain in Swiss Army Knife RNA repair proteins
MKDLQNHMKDKPVIFLDLDGVIVTSAQHYDHLNPKWNNPHFDKKCVNVYNEIIEETGAITILSSDWKDKFDLKTLNEIFKHYGMVSNVVDVTNTYWKIKYHSSNDLEECRANEILDYVKEYDIEKWLAIDDFNLLPFLPDITTFIRCKRSNEGIKQCNIKENIIKRLL